MSTSRPQFILAKPPAERVTDSTSSGGDSVFGKPHDKSPIVVLKSRAGGGGGSGEDGTLSSTLSSPNIQSLLAADSLPQQAYPGNSRHGASRGEGSTRVSQNSCVKLVDETFAWNELGMELLMDQPDFFTIGVLGLQGTGKSTIASLLAGNNVSPTNRYVFRCQTPESRDFGSHETVGVDMFVTGERIVILDSQPVLSSSLLDSLLEHDKKHAEFNEYSIEMQSLQMVSFMMTVCHVIVVVLDWFIDINILRFLQAAEMLKPATPPGGHEGTEVNSEYYPSVVFLLNQGQREDFNAYSQNAMNAIITTALKNSKLKYTGGVTMANSGLITGVNHQQVTDNVNLFVLPSFTATQHINDAVHSLLPDFIGHPRFHEMFTGFRNLLFAMPRSLLTHTVLSERNWFHYAARTWESVKKSSLFAEYSRLYSWSV